MDNKPIDKESVEWEWRKYFGSQRVEDVMWRSTDHGPEWTQKEIKEAVNEKFKSLKRLGNNVPGIGNMEDYAPKKNTKKKLIEYIKKNI